MGDSRTTKFIADQQDAVAILRDEMDTLKPYNVRYDALYASINIHKERHTSTMDEVIDDAKKVEKFLKGAP